MSDEKADTALNDSLGSSALTKCKISYAECEGLQSIKGTGTCLQVFQAVCQKEI